MYQKNGRKIDCERPTPCKHTADGPFIDAPMSSNIEEKYENYVCCYFSSSMKDEFLKRRGENIKKTRRFSRFFSRLIFLFRYFDVAKTEAARSHTKHTIWMIVEQMWPTQSQNSMSQPHKVASFSSKERRKHARNKQTDRRALRERNEMK